jgi:hypothetical protein
MVTFRTLIIIIMEPEWWGSPLAQEEKYQGKNCDKRKK